MKVCVVVNEEFVGLVNEFVVEVGRLRAFFVEGGGGLNDVDVRVKIVEFEVIMVKVNCVVVVVVKDSEEEFVKLKSKFEYVKDLCMCLDKNL